MEPPGLARGNERRSPATPGSRAAGGAAAEGPWLGPGAADALLEAAPRFAPSARSGGHWPEPLATISWPQTASRGDAATACAVPLKAAGSARLSFSTGCQNMQIRGPESAAKSRRRGAADASPDPLLVWLFPAWRAARRPSLQPPEPLLRPAPLCPPPTARPAARPPPLPGREPGAEALHALIPAGARAAALPLPAPRGRRRARGRSASPG